MFVKYTQEQSLILIQFYLRALLGNDGNGAAVYSGKSSGASTTVIFRVLLCNTTCHPADKK